MELRAIVVVLRAVRAEYQRELALAAIHAVAVALAAGVSVGGVALDGGDILPADALADAAMVGLVRRTGEVVDQHVAGPVALGDPLPVCLRPAHQLAAGGRFAAVHKKRLVCLLKAPPHELHTPVHAVHMQRAAAANIDRGIGKAAPQEDASESGEKTAPAQAEKPSMTDFKPYVGRKRRSGTGCVSEINDHLFEGRYSPKWPDGKKHARNVYAHTREECEEKLKVLIAEMKAEIVEAQRLKELEIHQNGTVLR